METFSFVLVKILKNTSQKQSIFAQSVIAPALHFAQDASD
jgi:hypothetical protein